MRAIWISAGLAAIVVAGALAWTRINSLSSSARLMVAAAADRDGAVELHIRVSVLEPGVRYLARLVQDDEGAPNANSGLLGTIVADPAGTGELRARSATMDAGVAVPLTEELLRDGRALVLASEGGEVVARTWLVLN